jgi:hypothetical protein
MARSTGCARRASTRPPCFAALLGGPEHGRWQIAPDAAVQRTQRRYRAHTLILETDFETEGGAVRVVDCMPLAERPRDIVRSVECLRMARSACAWNS